MKKLLLVLVLAIVCSVGAMAQAKEYKILTTIESVVPGGLGRSRMITTDSKGGLEETNLENFFSLVGINFNNVKENDFKVATRLQGLSNDGWNLEHVSSGVYGADKSTGIFVTRYLFSKGTNSK